MSAARYEDMDYTGSPIRIRACELDDYTPADKCVALVGALREAGFDASISVYPKAHHAFAAYYAPVRCDECYTLRECPRIPIDREGHARLPGTAISTRTMDWETFIRELFATCGSHGITAGGSERTRRRALKDTVEFFSAEL